MDTIWIMLLAVVGFNLAMFVPAYIYKTDKLTDISYALSFVVLILFSYGGSSQKWPHVLMTLFVIWWAVRLGGFLLMRIRNKGKDKRFDGMRENPVKFLRFWLLQGVSVFVVLISALLFMQVKNPQISAFAIVGIIIFGVGLYIEATADLQKWHFSQDVKNKGKWIESGIWSKSRHPNYLGEMMVWGGLYVFAFTSLSSTERLVALLSPVYIIVLLLFVSGIPLLEKSADKKWGSQKTYQDYKKRVPKLLPKL